MTDTAPSETCLIRKLALRDRAILCEHYSRLDDEAMRMRFNGMLSDEAIQRQVDRSFSFGTLFNFAFARRSVLHGCFIDGQLRAVAELCQDGPYLRRQGEAAFSVEASWRHHGIATELFWRTLRSARNRGFRTLMISCLAWNLPMRALAAKFKAELRIEDGSVIGTIVSPAPSSFSMFEEWAQDAQAQIASLETMLGCVATARS